MDTRVRPYKVTAEDLSEHRALFFQDKISGHWFAHGWSGKLDELRWEDTVQLDLAQPAVREFMIEQVKELARKYDGARWDVPWYLGWDYFKAVWYPNMPEEEFEKRWPRNEEFLPRAIAEAKKINPGFIVAAEVCTENKAENIKYMKQLMSMGFDYVYDYNFYGLLINFNRDWKNQLKIFVKDIFPYEDSIWGPAERLRDYLRQFSSEERKKLLFFLENQDTPRIRELIPDIEELKALSVIAAVMSGGLLINNGQELGKNGENLSATFIADSGTTDKKIKRFYTKLFSLLNRDLFRKGGFEMLIPQTGRKKVFAAWRSFAGEQALTVVNCSDKARVTCEVELPVMLHPDKTYDLVDAFNPQIFFELRGASVKFILAPWQAHIFFIEESPRHHEDFPAAEKLIGQAV